MTGARAPSRSKFWWMNAVALAVGCAFVVAGVLLGEIALRIASPWGPRAEEHDAPPYMEPSAALGWQPKASLRTHTKKIIGDEVLYDVTYTFDEHRRRVVPTDPAVSHPRFLLFFGCSHTFGEGVEDDETLPYYVSRLLPDTHAYNYAFRGYGPQHMLARLEASNLRDEVAEPAGAAVFVFPALILNRLIGGSATLYWVPSLPYYRLENGEPIREGFFQTTRPLYSLFGWALGTSRLMQHLNIAWPLRQRPEDLALACAVLGKAKRLLDAQLGPTPLVVVLHPVSWFLDLATCLDPLGIPVLDYHALFPEAERGAMTIPRDGHTSARGNQVLATQLAADIRDVLP